MGTIIGFLFLISGLPQTWKLMRSKDSRGISRTTYGITVLAIYLTLFQAYQSEAWEIFISTGMSAIITTTNLILILRYHYAK